ncbi:MAG: chemotaxis protein CheW [Acidobacteriota bacterium]|nr:chemotaxis protein CheW [Acidobacteriota bacterium]
MRVNRYLTFECSGARYGLSLAAIAAVDRIGALRRIPDTAPEVLGLASRRGKVLTVLDVCRLVGTETGSGGVILLLDPPFDRTALCVPAPVRLRPVTTIGNNGPATDDTGCRVTVVDVRALVEAARARGKIRHGSGRLPEDGDSTGSAEDREPWI